MHFSSLFKAVYGDVQVLHIGPSTQNIV